MRSRALLLALLLLPLAGCLDNPEVNARLDETRGSLARAQGDVANLSAETRAWQDNASRLGNESRLSRAQLDDAMGLLNVSQESLAARDAALAATKDALEAASANVTALTARVAEAEKVTLDGSTLADITGQLKAAQADLARTQALYDKALAQKFDTLTSIARANVTWQFTDLRGDTHQWRYALSEYRDEVKRSRPGTYLYIDTKGGQSLRVPDPRPYVDTTPFVDVIGDLTNGRSEQDFVREVFHLKRQLVVYDFALVDEKGFYKYPGETLVEGTGVCGDTTILLQSLLEAGKQKAGYTYTSALWIVDWNTALGHLVQDPETVNHALIEVKFADGTTWYVETTSFDFTLHPQAYGWRYDWPT